MQCNRGSAISMTFIKYSHEKCLLCRKYIFSVELIQPKHVYINNVCDRIYVKGPVSSSGLYKMGRYSTI